MFAAVSQLRHFQARFCSFAAVYRERFVSAHVSEEASMIQSHAFWGAMGSCGMEGKFGSCVGCSALLLLAIFTLSRLVLSCLVHTGYKTSHPRRNERMLTQGTLKNTFCE